MGNESAVVDGDASETGEEKEEGEGEEEEIDDAVATCDVCESSTMP